LNKGRVGIGTLISIAVGFVITLVTGLFRTLGTQMGVDFVMRGTPFPWKVQVFPRPAYVLWLVFFADVAFWILVSLIVSIIVLSYLSRTHSARRTTRSL
jgi:uncharacterized membrane protein